MLKTGALNEVQKYRKTFVEPATYISANSIIGIYEIGLYQQKKIGIKDLKDRVLLEPVNMLRDNIPGKEAR